MHYAKRWHKRKDHSKTKSRALGSQRLFDGKRPSKEKGKTILFQRPFDGKAKGALKQKAIQWQWSFEGKVPSTAKAVLMANYLLWLTRRPFNGKRHLLAKASDGKRPSMAKPETFESKK